MFLTVGVGDVFVPMIGPIKITALAAQDQKNVFCPTLNRAQVSTFASPVTAFTCVLKKQSLSSFGALKSLQHIYIKKK